MAKKLCIVTEFEQADFFQWTIAIEQFAKLEVSSIVVNPDTIKLHVENSEYWNPIRTADVIFVYCVRQNKQWKWYELPLVIKKWMKKRTKIICQFDLEFLWLFCPNHHPWDDEPRWTDGKPPKRFFNENPEVMSIADAYIIFFNDELSEYTEKPVYNIPLPQLVRYQRHLRAPLKSELNERTKRIAVIWHTVHSASEKHTLNHVIIPLKYPSAIFTCRSTNQSEKLRILKDLPMRGESEVYGLINRNDYMDFLGKCRAAIDDNEGYIGWSRFAMECALAHVPCVGSTLAVKEFFPRLYTEHKDYVKQRELIDRLLFDDEFWLEMVIEGKRNVLTKLNTEALVEQFSDIVKDICKFELIRKISHKITTVRKKHLVVNEYFAYKKFVKDHLPKTIPNRPSKGSMVNDGILNEIINQEQWDTYYGRWRQFIEDKYVPQESLEVIEKEEKTEPLYEITEMPTCTIYRHKSGLTFSVPTSDISDLVSFHGEGHFIKEMVRQSSIGDDFDPDWIFWQLTVNGLPIKHICIPSAKARICARMIDLHHFPELVVNRLNKRKIDVLFTTYRYIPYRILWYGGPIVGIEEMDKDYYWKNVKAKIFWLPHSFDPKIFHPPRSEQYKYHIFAMGVVSEVYPLRKIIYPKLSKLCNENKWKMYMKPRPPFFESIKKLQLSSTFSAGKNYARALRLSKVCIFGSSIMKYPIKKWFEALGSGTCILADKPQCAEELGLVDGETYIHINEENWKEKLIWILQNDLERKRIAKNGLELALKRHTNEVRVRQMFDILRDA